ncbi:MAG: RNA-binding S4 domain-containing protein [Proteobacteria bacterium]|nr:RNA-binding S4 domain-containing protein [Pseudomonadota bacterium]
MGRRGTAASRSDGDSDDGTIRLDKWIWFARFQRARETCQDLIRKGHVRVNRRKVTQPGASVRAGDVLTLALPGRTLLVEVLMIAAKRGSVEEASTLYRIFDPPSSAMAEE